MEISGFVIDDKGGETQTGLQIRPLLSSMRMVYCCWCELKSVANSKVVIIISLF